MRPRKRPDERRNVRLNLRLTPSERLFLEEAALAARMSPSEYARMQMLKGRIVVRQGRTVTPELFTQLMRIGTNLNQIARRLNAGDPRRPDELGPLCVQLERLLREEVVEDGP